MLEIRASSSQHVDEVLHHLLRLFCNTASNQITRCRINRRLTRKKHKPVGLDSLRIRADRLRSGIGLDNCANSHICYVKSTATAVQPNSRQRTAPCSARRSPQPSHRIQYSSATEQEDAIEACAYSSHCSRGFTTSKSQNPRSAFILTCAQPDESPLHAPPAPVRSTHHSQQTTPHIRRRPHRQAPPSKRPSHHDSAESAPSPTRQATARIIPVQTIAPAQASDISSKQKIHPSTNSSTPSARRNYLAQQTQIQPTARLPATNIDQHPPAAPIHPQENLPA